MAKGIAVGMALYAHLANYKVCSSMGCFVGDILAAFDAAVDDRSHSQLAVPLVLFI